MRVTGTRRGLGETQGCAQPLVLSMNLPPGIPRGFFDGLIAVDTTRGIEGIEDVRPDGTQGLQLEPLMHAAVTATEGAVFRADMEWPGDTKTRVEGAPIRIEALVRPSRSDRAPFAIYFAATRRIEWDNSTIGILVEGWIHAPGSGLWNPANAHTSDVTARRFFGEEDPGSALKAQAIFRVGTRAFWLMSAPGYEWVSFKFVEVTATAACTEFVTLNGGPGRSMIYRSYSLDAPNPAVTRALIMVHGTNRNADHYFGTAMAAAFLAGAVDDTVVIAPHMIDRTDPKQDNEVVWATSWRTGGPAADNPQLSSFDFVDEILRKVANKKTFPNMKAIVVAGHSAGGQFATRYEMANKVHGTLGVPITYVVANPSSYAWPAAVRPLPQDDADPAKAKDGWSLTPDNAVHKTFTFGPFDVAKSATYNVWPMGLEKLTGYVEKMTADQIRKQLVERPTTYLLGQVDTLPLGGFDSSANAMAQGPTRRARGEAFYKYVTETMGATHKIIIVPECGHNDRCIYTTDVVFPAVFSR